MNAIKRKAILFLQMCREKNVWIFAGVTLASFGLIFALNQMTEFRSDDLDHMRLAGTNLLTRNFNDILYSLQQHYQYVNGRYFAHLIARVLLWWQKPYCSIANAIVVSMIGIVLCYYTKSKNVIMLITATVLTYFLNADFDGTCNWITGSSNYVWTIMIVLLFLIPYFRLLGNNASQRKWVSGG